MRVIGIGALAKITKSDFYLRHVCPSAWNSSVPTRRILFYFFWNLLREYFSKLCR